MKPAWDALMKAYEGHKSILIGDVDCTADGKSLCDANGVRGYPTIKHGDPANLEDYNGGRSESDLKEFAKGLKPLCSPANMDLCDEEGKNKIESIMALSDDEIKTQIEAGEQKIKDAESTFESELQKLQDAYQKLQKNKEDTIAEVKASGLGLLKSVQAHKAKSGKEEL